MKRQINIPFNQWSKTRLKLGVKTATSRRKKYGQVGDTFIENNTEYIIIKQIHLPLETVTSKFWKEEGAKSPQEFKQIWESIHPKARYQPDMLVWLHLFKKVD